MPRLGQPTEVAPEGAAWAPPRARVDSTLVKALARAFRWWQMLEIGRFASVTELAEVEKVNHSYLCRMLRLTLLAPDTVQAVLDRRGPELTLPKLMVPWSIEWAQQRRISRGFPASCSERCVHDFLDDDLAFPSVDDNFRLVFRAQP